MMKRLLVGLALSLNGISAAQEPQQMIMEHVLLLPPGPGNPRNSEGDFVRLADGSILFVYTHFTGGGSDHAAAHLASRISRDDGRTWSDRDEVLLRTDAGCNVMSVSLLRLADGRIALFCLQKESLTDCRPFLWISTDEMVSLSPPIPVVGEQDIGYYVLNNDRVIQLSSGRLLAPLAWHNGPDRTEPDWAGRIECRLSDDGGRTWRRSTTRQRALAPDGRRVVAQEPLVVERSDGQLWMLVRTNAGVQYQATSSDGGDVWSPLTPTDIASPQSPASIECLPGGNTMAMLWNDHSSVPPELKGRRTPLVLALSRDDGRSWSRQLTLEDDPDGWYCYTAIQAVDGALILAYCTGKRAQALATTQIARITLD